MVGPGLAPVIFSTTLQGQCYHSCICYEELWLREKVTTLGSCVNESICGMWDIGTKVDSEPLVGRCSFMGKKALELKMVCSLYLVPGKEDHFLPHMIANGSQW